MSAKQILIQLFQLPQNEIIFQDYSCALKKGLLKYGRVFISENNICFYANIGGTKIKLVINFDNIQSIDQKSKSDIEITTKDNKTYLFASFSDRDQVYYLMHGLFTGVPVNMSLIKDSVILEHGNQEEPSQADGVQLENAEVEVSFLNADGKNADEEIELMKVVLPVSLDKFFELFLSDEAIYSFSHHRILIGDTDVQLSKWLPIDENPGQFQREMKSIMKLTDVPFKDKSRFHKIQTYQKEGNKLIFKQTSHTLDVPYANYFQAEEKWEVVEQEPNKCQIRCFGWIVFVKSTYMKKLITTKTIQGYKDDYERWITNVKKKLETTNKSQAMTRQSSTHEYESITDQQATQLTKVKKNEQQKNDTKKNNQSFLKKVNQQKVDSLIYLMLFTLLLLILTLIIIQMLMVSELKSKIISLEQFVYAKNNQKDGNYQIDL